MVWQLWSCCLVCMHGNEGIGWLSAWAQYVPSSGSFLPKSISRLMGPCVLCDGEEHKLLNERKRHRVPRLSASVESTMYKGQGIEELESTEQMENAGDVPGVDHAPEDSRFPHSVTRGAWRITILRAKMPTACQSFSLSHICYLSQSTAATQAVVPGCSI